MGDIVDDPAIDTIHRVCQDVWRVGTVALAVACAVFTQHLARISLTVQYDVDGR